MGFFDEHEDAYNTWNNSDATQHDPSIAHELIAGAASYEASKAYEDHVARNGPPPNHRKAKELLAGFVGAFIDREVETKGLDFIDRERAKHHAQAHIDNVDPEEFGY